MAWWAPLLAVGASMYSARRNRPRRPEQKDYGTFAADEYFGWREGQGTDVKGRPRRGRYRGGGASRTFGMDVRAFDAIKKNLKRNPGFLQEDLDAMYNAPAAQLKAGEAGTLRRMNQNAAATGRFGSGSSARGRGMVMSSTQQALAQNRWQTRALQARAALQDRYNQMRLAEQYASRRLGLMGQEHRTRAGYMGGQNLSQQRGYEYDAQRHDQRSQWRDDLIWDITSSLPFGQKDDRESDIE